jgi:hypothetical protein
MSEILTPPIKKAVVVDLANLAKEKYLFPEMGEKIAAYLLDKLKEDGYDEFTEPSEFALALKTDLCEVSNDKHWDVFYDAKAATVQYGELDDEDNEAEMGQLSYTSPKSTVWKLVPMAERRLRLNEEIKFEFIVAEHGSASKVIITYQDGRPELTIPRTGSYP